MDMIDRKLEITNQISVGIFRYNHNPFGHCLGLRVSAIG